MAIFWNLWHGCTKVSEGCLNCYMYAADKKFGRDSHSVHKTQNFDLPLKKNRQGEYKIPAGETLYTCFTSDFFIETADDWRLQAWTMMAKRPDLHFFLTTKRIERVAHCLPEDWGDGYDHLTLCCTVENQKQADKRLPIYLNLPIKNKTLICEPLLSPIDLRAYLMGKNAGKIQKIIVGGESGEMARPCDYAWVLELCDQCRQAGVEFVFKQTGANFIKDGKHYHIPRQLQHLQAKKANINLILNT